MAAKNAATLRAVGEALYGPTFQTALTAALGNISDRTMRRWLADEFAIPDGVWADLAALCLARSTQLGNWAERLAPAAAKTG
jgi:hypothetical protein